MIELITGKIGGGKTLRAVGEMIRHLGKGGTVCTNVELIWDECCLVCEERYGVKLLREQFRPLDLNSEKSWQLQIPFGEMPGAVLVVLDEIHLFYNSRNWAETQKKHGDLVSFLSQSRKVHVEIRFLCQASTNLDKQFRLQCEYEIFTRRLADIKVPLFGNLPFNRMLVVTRDNAKDTSAKPLGHQILKYDKRLFRCYNTLALVDGIMAELEKDRERVGFAKLKRIAPWWAKRSLYQAFCVAVLLLLFTWRFL